MRRLRLAPLAGLPLAIAVLAVACGPSAPDPLASFSGASVTIVARDIAFDPDIVTMPANEPLRLVLDNQDAGVPHDLRVFQGDTDLGTSPIVTGPGLTAIELPPLAPGRYQFECTIHPVMIGTIVVAVGASPGASSTGDAAAPARAGE
jgi:plastocyanin